MMFMKPSTSDKVENTQDLELRPDVNLGSVTHRPHTRRQYFNLSIPVSSLTEQSSQNHGLLGQSNEMCTWQYFERYKISHKDLTYQVLILVLQEKQTFFYAGCFLFEIVWKTSDHVTLHTRTTE